MLLVPRDYVAANNFGSRIIVVLSWIFPVIATSAVAGRFAARRFRKSDLGWDDWVILSALVPLWGHTAVILASVYLAGIGHHESELDANNAVVLFKILTALQFSFGVSLGLVKISIVFLLMRIFFTRTFKIVARVVLVYCVCWMLMAILIGACMCRPFALNWNPTLKGHCGHRIPAYIAIAATDIVGDIMLLSLPMPMIWKLHVSTASKVGLSVVFALGFLDIIVAILRIIYLVALNTAADYTWVAVDCWIWSVLEPSLAVVVACGPTLGPFIGAILGRLPTKKSSSSKQYPSYPSYPARREQFSNISDSEYPLQPRYGNYAIAGSKHATAGAAVRGPSPTDDVEQIPSVGAIDTDTGAPHIRVQKDIDVRRSNV